MTSVLAFINSLSPQEQIIFYGLVTIIIVLIIFTIVKKLFKLAFFIALGVAILYFVLLYLGKKQEAEYIKNNALETVNQLKERVPDVIDNVKNSDTVKQTVDSLKDKVENSVKEVIKDQLK